MNEPSLAEKYNHICKFKVQRVTFCPQIYITTIDLFTLRQVMKSLPKLIFRNSRYVTTIQNHTQKLLQYPSRVLTTQRSHRI